MKKVKIRNFLSIILMVSLLCSMVFIPVLAENNFIHDERQKANYPEIINERSEKMMTIEWTNMLPPHLRDVIDSNPELLNIIMKTPTKELRTKLLNNDMFSDIPPRIIDELISNPIFMKANHDFGERKSKPFTSKTGLDNSIEQFFIENADPINSINDFGLCSDTSVSGPFIQIACGSFHSLALHSDGAVWACGYNDYGQLGDGTTTYKNTPVQVNGLSGITAIAGGYDHSLALKNDGTVWAWGANYNGQLGDGTTIDRTTPMQVSGLSGIIAVACGSSHSMAQKNDGTVWAWGNNYWSQLGDGTTTDRATPVQISGLSGIIAIACGNSHSMALEDGGIVWAWGANYNRQLGDGTTTDRTTPVQVTGLSGITAIACGYSHNLALKYDSTVWVWGGGTLAVPVSGLSGITAIACGDNHSLVLKNDGTVWAWGDNMYSQLGDGTGIDKTTPVQVIGLNGIIAIAGGDYHSLALTNDGAVWAWGDASSGQLGDGTVIVRTSAIQVSELNGISEVACGDYHSIALKSDGTVWVWGSNWGGQLGDGTTTSRTTAVQVSGLYGITAVACGDYHSIALKNDGTVWAWGNNSSGLLGDGTTTQRTTPVKVYGLNGITAIACGHYHSLALKNDGTAWVWGYNSSGQLGDGTKTVRLTPVQVSGLNGIMAIAGGYNHSLALKNNGIAWAWGYNSSGQLGDGTKTTRITPVQVSGLNGTMAIAGGHNHSLALKNDGTAWAWGDNWYGKLGDGTEISKTTPVQVSGLNGATEVACGDYHSLALKNDGTVWAWGYNGLGQLGDGTTTRRTIPLQTGGLIGNAAIACGSYHSLALKNDGTVWAWGDNWYGQLGNGEKAIYEYAKCVIGTIATNYTPSVNIISPTQDMIFSETSSSFVPVVAVSDPDGDTLTCKVFIDSESLPRDTKTISNTQTSQNVFFNALNVGNLSEGTHTMTFAVNDSEITQQATISIKVDKTAPILGSVNVTSTKNTITITGSATDNIAMNDVPYRYYAGNNDSLWNTSSSYTFSNLLSNTQYQVKFVARDKVGHLSENIQNIYTKALKPVISVGNANETSLVVSCSENNPSGTQYLFSCGSQYVNAQGNLTSTPVWIAPSGKSITVSGLLPNTDYTFAVKAKNGDGIETEVSDAKSGKTLALPPQALEFPEIKQNSIKIIWSPILGATAYEIEVDGYVINNSLSNTYTHSGLQPKTSHTYRVRVINIGGTGNWSSYLQATTLPNQVSTIVSCIAGKPFNMILSAQNLTDLEELIFTITYDPEDISGVVDLCAMTYQKDLGTGLIPGTGITILNKAPGEIKFKVDKAIQPDKSWSGIINIITLMPSISGQITINYTVE